MYKLKCVLKGDMKMRAITNPELGYELQNVIGQGVYATQQTAENAKKNFVKLLKQRHGKMHKTWYDLEVVSV